MDNRQRKAVRLVLQGRVKISRRDDNVLEGTVVGDSGRTYLVRLTPDGDSCGCAWSLHHPQSPCAHIRALMLQERTRERRNNRA